MALRVSFGFVDFPPISRELQWRNNPLEQAIAAERGLAMKKDASRKRH
jgi:hypothetical protein